MRRKSSQSAADEVAAVADDRLLAAADRIGPLAQAAADRLEALAAAVVPLAHNAADRVGPLAHTAAERVSPVAHSAAGRVSPLAHSAMDRLSPLALSAYGRMSPYVDSTRLRVAPFTSGVSGRVGPVARSARRQGARVARDAVERFSPVLDDAMGRVSPAVEAARGRVQEDLIPKLIEVLSAAAATPVVAEATKRGKATLAAAKGELVLPEPEPPKRSRRWLTVLVVLGAVGGIGVVAYRKLLGSHEADWQAARPSTPYVPPTPPTTAPTDGQATDSSMAAEGMGGETADSGASTPEPADALASPDDATAQADVLGAEVAVAEADEAGTVTPTGSEEEDGILPEADRSRYGGEGVYIGTEPPEGFFIKANERSMKYHLPESSGYSATRTEVWFNSEEAAQAAGFVRAQS